MHLFRHPNTLFEFKMKHQRLEMLTKSVNFLKKDMNFRRECKDQDSPNDGEFPIVKDGTTIVRVKGGVQFTTQAYGQ